MRELFTVILMLILSTSRLCAQNECTFYVSGGYGSHLSMVGLNLEFGADIQMFKHLNFSMAHRFNKMQDDVAQVVINNTSMYLSLTAINKNSHRLNIGPGVAYGDYYRSYPENDTKDYTSFTFNPVRIQYDYLLTNGIRYGSVIGLYGDDGDGTLYGGITIGYSFTPSFDIDYF